METGEGLEMIHNNHSKQSEAHILSCIILENSLYLDAIEAGISDSSFWTPATRVVWETIHELSSKGEGIDEVILYDNLSKKTNTDGNNVLDLIGGAATLGEICNAAEHTFRFDYHVSKIIDHESERRLAKACSEALGVSQETEIHVGERICRVESILSGISDKGIEKSFKTASGSISGVVEHLHKVNNRQIEPGLSTGLVDFDNLIGTMRRQNIIIVAARPGVGKTSFGLCIAENVAKKGKRPLFFSFEMGAEQLLSRMACAMASLSYKRISGGLATRVEMDRLDHARELIERFDMPILDDPRMDILRMQSKARALHRKKPCDLIIVDYLQKIPAQGQFRSREQEVAGISWALTTLAKEMNIPIVVLAQCNRDAEKEKRYPRSSDLRESGAIEQDAHVVNFLSKVDKDGNELPSGEIHVVCTKNRDWSAGVIPITFNENYARFENYVRPPGY